MRALFLLLPVVTACQTDSGVQATKDAQTTDVGNGTLAVSSDYLNFGEVALQVAESITFTVSSTGDEPLDIFGARLVANPSAAFTFEEREDLVLAAGEAQDWTVAAYPTVEGKYEGSLRIESNDATFPTLFIAMCVVSEGFAESCPADMGGDDTGDADTGDTGTEDTGDTGGDTADSGI